MGIKALGTYVSSISKRSVQNTRILYVYELRHMHVILHYIKIYPPIKYCMCYYICKLWSYISQFFHRYHKIDALSERVLLERPGLELEPALHLYYMHPECLKCRATHWNFHTVLSHYFLQLHFEFYDWKLAIRLFYRKLNTWRKTWGFGQLSTLLFPKPHALRAVGVCSDSSHLRTDFWPTWESNSHF